MKSLCTAGLLAAITFAGNAHAGPTWTITLAGTIQQGTDTSGVFGVAGRDLPGLSFTQSITASVDPSQYSMTYEAPDTHLLYGIGPSAQTSVTVDGMTISFATTPGQSELQSVYHEFPVAIGPLDSIFTRITGATTTAGVQIEASNSAYSYGAPFLSGTGFDINADLVDPSIFKEASFALSGSQTAQFFGTASRAAVTYDAGTDVPEPASVALLCAGLFGLALSRRRKAD